MTVTLDQAYPFDAGAGGSVTEAQWRRMVGNIGLNTGVMRGIGSEFIVTQRAAGANMSVDIAAGECRIRGHVGILTTVPANLGIDANPTGNGRIDLIVLVLDASGNTMYLDVVKGTPAASPAVPALTQTSVLYQISIAQIAVAAGAVSIVTANITDVRQWANATRWGLKWGISGVQVTPSGAANYLIPVLFELELGWTAVIDNAYGAIRGGTSATYKFQKSASIAAALADVTGLTGLTAQVLNAANRTQLATTAEVAIVNGAMVAPVLTAVSASPDNLSVGIGGWKYPTPIVV